MKTIITSLLLLLAVVAQAQTPDIAMTTSEDSTTVSFRFDPSTPDTSQVEFVKGFMQEMKKDVENTSNALMQVCIQEYFLDNRIIAVLKRKNYEIP